MFRKNGQRKFFDLVIERLGSPSLRGLLQFGFDVNYSTLKNYYIGVRLISKDLFDDFCYVARVKVRELRVGYVDGNWGQKKGGEKSKRRKI